VVAMHCIALHCSFRYSSSEDRSSFEKHTV
jgi:hypothetical protein